MIAKLMILVDAEEAVAFDRTEIGFGMYVGQCPGGGRSYRAVSRGKSYGVFGA